MLWTIWTGMWPPEPQSHSGICSKFIFIPQNHRKQLSFMERERVTGDRQSRIQQVAVDRMTKNPLFSIYYLLSSFSSLVRWQTLSLVNSFAYIGTVGKTMNEIYGRLTTGTRTLQHTHTHTCDATIKVRKSYELWSSPAVLYKANGTHIVCMCFPVFPILC